MLESLRRLVQDANAAKNLDEALSVIVQGVKESIQVDACSVYLNDVQRSRYVLMASDGLNPVSAQGFVEIQSVEARALARAARVQS